MPGKNRGLFYQKKASNNNVDFSNIREQSSFTQENPAFDPSGARAEIIGEICTSLSQFKRNEKEEDSAILQGLNTYFAKLLQSKKQRGKSQEIKPEDVMKAIGTIYDLSEMTVFERKELGNKIKQLVDLHSLEEPKNSSSNRRRPGKN